MIPRGHPGTLAADNGTSTAIEKPHTGRGLSHGDRTSNRTRQALSDGGSRSVLDLHVPCIDQIQSLLFGRRFRART